MKFVSHYANTGTGRTLEDTANPASASNEKTSKPARRKRNRRRAKDLSDARLREIKRDFEIRRNSLEVAQNHLLPRAEAVDGVLIRVSDEIRTVRMELTELRRQMGVAQPSEGLRIVRRQAA